MSKRISLAARSRWGAVGVRSSPGSPVVGSIAGGLHVPCPYGSVCRLTGTRNARHRARRLTGCSWCVPAVRWRHFTEP
jgi:hypothetical protein